MTAAATAAASSWARSRQPAGLAGFSSRKLLQGLPRSTLAHSCASRLMLCGGGSSFSLLAQLQVKVDRGQPLDYTVEGNRARAAAGGPCMHRTAAVVTAVLVVQVLTSLGPPQRHWGSIASILCNLGGTLQQLDHLPRVLPPTPTPVCPPAPFADHPTAQARANYPIQLPRLTTPSHPATPSSYPTQLPFNRPIQPPNPVTPHAPSNLPMQLPPMQLPPSTT
ncbi:hypothetical protein ABBQ38_014737 [Trebouxia sp. C0009 RCD-2024]